MLLLTQNQLKWEKSEWISFVATFCVLILYPLMNGYPFIFLDSWGYASGICPSNFRSPVLGCAMRPAVLLGGPWGYVVAQSAATAFSLVFLSNIVLKRYYKYTFYLSLIISGVGYYAGFLMADVWTLIGFICLFSISMGYGYAIIAVLLAFSCSVHFGNFPIFTSTALLFLPFVRYKLKYITIISICILSAIVLIITANLFFGGAIRISPRLGGFSLLSSRILHDIPEVIDKKCLDDPEFKLCEIKEEIHGWSRSRRHQRVTFVGKEQLNISWNELNELSKDVVFYSLKEFFVEHLLALVRNTYGLLSCYGLADGMIPFSSDGDSAAIRGLKRHFPDELDVYSKSWQARGKLKRRLELLEMPLSVFFGISIMICLAYIGFYWKTGHEDVIFKLSIFAVIAVLVNAFFMSNLSGIYARFQGRIVFLLIFPALALISRLSNSLRKRIVFYLKKEKS
jgi:hypothetical protein